jgi:hypothetical protein
MGGATVATVADDQLRASWRRSAAHLRDALRELDLPDDVRHTALDDLAHNELGIAFEHLVYVLAEANAEITAAARHALRGAAAEMHLEENPDWRRLAT